MKTDKSLYGRAKQDANYIAELATQLELLARMEEQGSLKKDVDPVMEERMKRNIKNSISNIYLVLDLHEVKGNADAIYDADFKPAE